MMAGRSNAAEADAIAAAALAARKPAPSVYAYPCDVESDDYKIGPIIADNRHGISSDGGYIPAGATARTPAVTVKWEGIAWRIAESPKSGILYVLAPTREVVESWRPALTRLAEGCRDYGGLKNVFTELLHHPSLPPRADGAKPRASNKRLALNAVTEAVRDAYKAGATTQDVRLAVLSALGLDSDEAR